MLFVTNTFLISRFRFFTFPVLLFLLSVENFSFETFRKEDKDKSCLSVVKFLPKSKFTIKWRKVQDYPDHFSVSFIPFLTVASTDYVNPTKFLTFKISVDSGHILKSKIKRSFHLKKIWFFLSLFSLYLSGTSMIHFLSWQAYTFYLIIVFCFFLCRNH